jgi:hypothetical protein
MRLILMRHGGQMLERAVIAAVRTFPAIVRRSNRSFSLPPGTFRSRRSYEVGVLQDSKRPALAQRSGPQAGGRIDCNANVSFARLLEEAAGRLYLAKLNHTFRLHTPLRADNGRYSTALECERRSATGP